jgi:hypothetical protein
MKKPKTLERKLESALRLIWSRSSERRQIIKDSLNEKKEFKCPVCGVMWGAWAADVDHEPPLGGLQSWKDIKDYIQRLFWGPQRPMCKPCHKGKTAKQRKKK